MRTITKEFTLYKYNELNKNGKEKVKKWLLDDTVRNDIFYEEILMYLHEEYPRSDLKVTYSLGYCQGDGLNVYGELNFYDMLSKLKGYTEKDIKTLENYFEKVDHSFNFERNNRYSYSCKFIDKKYVDNYVNDFIDDLKYFEYKNINIEIIKRFYEDMLNHFEELDRRLEKKGYEYLYNISEEEAEEECEANQYMFFEDGSAYQKVCAFNM